MYTGIDVPIYTTMYLHYALLRHCARTVSSPDNPTHDYASPIIIIIIPLSHYPIM